MELTEKQLIVLKDLTSLEKFIKNIKTKNNGRTQK